MKTSIPRLTVTKFHPKGEEPYDKDELAFGNEEHVFSNGKKLDPEHREHIRKVNKELRDATAARQGYANVHDKLARKEPTHKD